MIVRFLAQYWRRLLVGALGTLLAGFAVNRRRSHSARHRIANDDLIKESPSWLARTVHKRRRGPGGGGMSAAGATTATKSQHRTGGVRIPQAIIARPATKLATALERAGVAARLASRSSEAVVLVRDLGIESRNLGAIADVVHALGAEAMTAGVGRKGEWEVERSFRDSTGELNAVVQAGERRIVVRVVDPVTFQLSDRGPQRSPSTQRSAADDFGISRELRRR